MIPEKTYFESKHQYSIYFTLVLLNKILVIHPAQKKQNTWEIWICMIDALFFNHV